MVFHTSGGPNRFADYLTRQVQKEEIQTEIQDKLEEEKKAGSPFLIEGKRRKFAFFQSAQKVDPKKVMGDSLDLSAVAED